MYNSCHQTGTPRSGWTASEGEGSLDHVNNMNFQDWPLPVPHSFHPITCKKGEVFTESPKETWLLSSSRQPQSLTLTLRPAFVRNKVHQGPWLRALVFCIFCALPVWWFGSKLMWKWKEEESCWIKLTMKYKLAMIPRDHISSLSENVWSMTTLPSSPSPFPWRTPSGRVYFLPTQTRPDHWCDVANEMCV